MEEKVLLYFSASHSPVRSLRWHSESLKLVTCCFVPTRKWWYLGGGGDVTPFLSVLPLVLLSTSCSQLPEVQDEFMSLSITELHALEYQ